MKHVKPTVLSFVAFSVLSIFVLTDLSVTLYLQLPVSLFVADQAVLVCLQAEAITSEIGGAVYCFHLKITSCGSIRGT